VQSVTPETIDAARTWNSTALGDLIELHARLFPTHPHVHAEFRDWHSRSGIGHERTAHLLLTYVGTDPAALLVLHIDTPRGIGLIHFLGVAPPYRASTTGRASLARNLLGLAWDIGAGDLGQRWVGLVAESEPDLVRVWGDWGFHDLGVDYAEPHHGMHWAQFGAPTFFHMRLMGQGNGPSHDLAEAAVESFLVDHYALPTDHPVVRTARASIPRP